MDVRCEWIFHEASIVVVPSSFSFCINAYPPTRFSGEAARRDLALRSRSRRKLEKVCNHTPRGSSSSEDQGEIEPRNVESARRASPSLSIPRLTYNYIIIILLIINYYYYHDDCQRAIEGVFYRETRGRGERERKI